MMTPPVTCVSQPSLLTTRPQSCTAQTLVQRTWPVSVSTQTSAICTPPTWPDELPAFSGLFDSAWFHMPAPFAWFMPRAAQASFQEMPLPLPLSTTLPGVIDRFSGLALSLGAILANKSSRAAEAACRVAGACDGQV